jgi:hypothetical protein
VCLLAYDLIRLLMAQAARTAGLYPGELSFKHTVQMWSSWTCSVEPTDANAPPVQMTGTPSVRRRDGMAEPREVSPIAEPVDWSGII